jgi:hypothetical protein
VHDANGVLREMAALQYLARLDQEHIKSIVLTQAARFNCA